MFASRLKIGHSLRTAWGAYWLSPDPGERLGLPRRGAVFNSCKTLGHKGRLLFLFLPGGSCRLWCLDNLIFSYLRCTPIAPICTAGLLLLPFVVRAQSISVCGDSLWIRLCVFNGVEGEGFSTNGNRKSAAYLYGKGFHSIICFWFFPLGAARTCQWEKKNIMFPGTGLSQCWLVWIAWCAKQSCFVLRYGFL